MTRRKFQYSNKNSKNSESFDYTEKGVIMKKSVSKALYQNEVTGNFLDHLSTLFSNLIDNVKRIRRHFMYSVDVDEMNID
jgi:hypothetical protein